MEGIDVFGKSTQVFWFQPGFEISALFFSSESINSNLI